MIIIIVIVLGSDFGFGFGPAYVDQVQVPREEETGDPFTLSSPVKIYGNFIQFTGLHTRKKQIPPGSLTSYLVFQQQLPPTQGRSKLKKRGFYFKEHCNSAELGIGSHQLANGRVGVPTPKANIGAMVITTHPIPSPRPISSPDLYKQQCRCKSLWKLRWQ
ncbi:GM12945 [Drosophila sechellia]|uniref:GM12945 n=1 Tax=Drosophila sechellia TaxID=7238 RepID=B4I032_DROSE|nr:GM12945 [Drosophila sechellia]